MQPANRRSIKSRIDDLNNEKFEEQYSQLYNELMDLKSRRELNRGRINAILERLAYLQEEINRFKNKGC